MFVSSFKLNRLSLVIPMIVKTAVEVVPRGPMAVGLMISVPVRPALPMSRVPTSRVEAT